MCGFQPTAMKRDGKTFYSQEFEAAKMLGSSAPGHNSVDSLDTVYSVYYTPSFAFEEVF